MVNYLRQHGEKMSSAVLNHVQKVIAKPLYVGVLSAVRVRLLDFLLELRAKYPVLNNSDAAAATLSEGDVDSVVENKVFQGCNFIGGDLMGDSYSNSGQIGAMGLGASAENINFVQIIRGALGDASLGDLAGELKRLRLAMLPESKTEKQDNSVAAVAQAEDAAKKGDAARVMTCLKTAGSWAASVAEKISVSVAAKVITKAMGMGV